MKNSCVSALSGADPQIRARRFRPIIFFRMVGKIAKFASDSQTDTQRLRLTLVLAQPRALRPPVNPLHESTRLPQLLVHRPSHALEQRWHVQEIVGRDHPHVLRDLAQVRVDDEQAAPQQRRQQQHPRPGKHERQVMEDPILPAFPIHQQIKPPIDTRQHVRDVPRVQHHALRFARGSRRIDDRDRIAIGQL